MPYMGWKKTEEEEKDQASKATTGISNKTDGGSSANGKTQFKVIEPEAKEEREKKNANVEAQKKISEGRSAADKAKPFANQPGVNQQVNEGRRLSDYYTQQGRYEDAREYGKRYINQIENLVNSYNERPELRSARYASQRFQEDAQRANAENNALNAIRGAYRQSQMPIRQKNIEAGGYGVQRGNEVPISRDWNSAALYNQINPNFDNDVAAESYYSMPNGGYTNINPDWHSSPDSFSDPFVTPEQLPDVSNALVNYLTPYIPTPPSEEERLLSYYQQLLDAIR